jgi:hypothetical protein
MQSRILFGAIAARRLTGISAAPGAVYQCVRIAGALFVADDANSIIYRAACTSR